MDPLSDVLSLLKPKGLVSGRIEVGGATAIQWRKHKGIKCYAVVSGQCWLSVEGNANTVHLATGDCFLLPPGPPFRIATDQSATPVESKTFHSARSPSGEVPHEDGGECSFVGGHFLLAGSHADILLGNLPPIVHIWKDSDKAVIRWVLERLNEEANNLSPGSFLITEQLAYMMLVQVLRLHLAEGPKEGVGWLFALSDKQMSAAISCVHDDPAHQWTVQNMAEHVGMSRSTFALRFKKTVGMTPIEYLTHWRMMLAGNRLENSNDSIYLIAASLGYESESAFGKAFRRVMGCSPRRYSRGAGAQLPLNH